MKSSIVAFLFLIGSSLFPQQDITNQVVALIKSGNANALSAHFVPKIDLAVDGVDDVYSRTQAALILKKFFTTHKVESFTIVHQGTTKLEIQYRIGTLSTNKGAYRVSFNMKKIGDKYFIQQLRIEENDEDF